MSGGVRPGYTTDRLRDESDRGEDCLYVYRLERENQICEMPINLIELRKDILLPWSGVVDLGVWRVKKLKR